MAVSEPVVEQDGEEWVTRVECLDCRKTIALRSDIDPRSTRFGLRLAKLYVCDGCAQLELEREERARLAADFTKRFNASGLPAAARELQWKDMITSGSRAKAIDAAKTWAQAEPRDARGLLLHGSVGTGKTRLAATAAVHRLRAFPLQWVSVAMLIARLQASFSDPDRAAALKVLKTPGALVLDDLDKVNPSETVRSQLFAAIETRIEAGVPLVITTNLPPTKLEQKFGEAIVSRVMGYCLGRTLLMDGPDRRLQLAVDQREEQ